MLNIILNWLGIALACVLAIATVFGVIALLVAIDIEVKRDKSNGR